MKGIKAVFFDAGGTLFQPHPSIGEIYAEVAGRHGLVIEPLHIEARFHTHWEKRDGLASLTNHSTPQVEREWWQSLVYDVFSEVGRFENFDGFFEELYDRFAGAGSWRLYPDALPILEKLKKKGKILGIVSNWDSRLLGICEGLGLTSCLDFILASAVVGVAKPHPDIFKEALRRAGVLPEEALHIGDSLKDDVWGAQQAGIPAIFVDRKGTRPSQTPSISSLQFLSGLFDN